MTGDTCQAVSVDDVEVLAVRNAAVNELCVDEIGEARSTRGIARLYGRHKDRVNSTIYPA